MDQDLINLYKELGYELPQHAAHGTEDEIRESSKIITVHSWFQEGNRLVCKCDLGTHSSVIPPTHILTGTSEDGLPILQKVVV